MKHLHKCGKYLIRLDSIHAIGDIEDAQLKVGRYISNTSSEHIPEHFQVFIGNEFGLSKLIIFPNFDDQLQHLNYKDRLTEYRNNLIKAWENYLEQKENT